MLKLKLQYFGHLMRRVDSLEKTLMLGGIGGRRKRDEMAEWYHWLYGHEFGWTLGVGDGQGGLVCCNSWGHKESDMTERLNWTDKGGGSVMGLGSFEEEEEEERSKFSLCLLYVRTWQEGDRQKFRKSVLIRKSNQLGFWSWISQNYEK